MSRYRVTGRSVDYRVAPWDIVPLTVGVGDIITATLTAEDEATLINAGIIVSLEPTTLDSADTITIPTGVTFALVAGTATITTITAGDPGDRVTLCFTDILMFTDGANLKLAGDLVSSADDTIALVSDGTNWIEEARSIN